MSSTSVSNFTSRSPTQHITGHFGYGHSKQSLALVLTAKINSKKSKQRTAKPK